MNSFLRNTYHQLISHKKIIIVGFVCGLLAILAIQFGGFIFWYCCTSLVALMFIAMWTKSFALNGYRCHRIDVQQHSNLYNHTLPSELSRLSREKQFTIVIERAGKSIIPVPWLLVKETWFHVQSERMIRFQWVISPWWKQTSQISYSMKNLLRGQYIAQQIELIFADCFGITEKKRSYQMNRQFVVYPEPLSQEDKETVNLGRLGTGVGVAVGVGVGVGVGVEGDGPRGKSSKHTRHLPYTSFLQRDVFEMEGLREYQCGESLSTLDWKASARQGKWLSKWYAPDTTTRYVLLTDERIVAPHSELLPEDNTCEQLLSNLYARCPLLEYRIRVSLCMVESLTTSNQQVEWSGHLASQRNDTLATETARYRSFYRHASALHGVPDQDGRLYAQRIRLHIARCSRSTSMLCVTSTLSCFLLAALAEARSKKLEVHVYFVHLEASLSADEREAKQKLQAMGCSFVAVPHLRSMWPALSCVHVTTSGHRMQMRMLVQSHEHAPQLAATSLDIVQEKSAMQDKSNLQGGAKVDFEYT